ncbi:S49 family peptidase [Pleionea sediminis]|uniref:S49 family peptidase n=1 Tax=Pleionea sediminis TaxID=2569479 RepID=UPI00118521A6|nr:S49 family peptidase [Pleionea sediminis]
MNHPYLFSLLVNEPWAIASQKMDVLLEIIEKGLLTGALTETQKAGLTGQRLESDDTLTGGVAVMNVTGTLVNRTSGLASLSGVRSYASLSNELQSLLDNELVQHIVLDIDSGGGMVAGLYDFVDQLYEARSVKPITAIINDSAFSAAYAIASSASRIIASRTGGAGSIGTIAKLVSRSKQHERLAMEIETITAGAKKADLDPDTPITDSARQKVQYQVNQSNELFLQTVSRNLGLPIDTLRSYEADFFTGEDAKAMGLVHDIMSPRDAFLSIVSDTQKKPTHSSLQRRAKAIALQ